MMAKNKNGSGFFSGALIGGLIGALVALFLAPKTGSELRNDLNEKATAAKNRSTELKNTAVEKGIVLAEYAKEKSAALSQVVQEQSSHLVDKVKQSSDQNDEETNRVQEDTLELAKEGNDEVEGLLVDAVKTNEVVQEEIKEEVGFKK
ncbi:YtxH domain-containing protein [Bacillus sp. DJP31]|uniref:YtxH domain-containing protein n=1 Tax=Bacillus sp. DJP31 TaxID=3409789 RepID=UPI003BB6F420